MLYLLTTIGNILIVLEKMVRLPTMHQDTQEKLNFMRMGNYVFINILMQTTNLWQTTSVTLAQKYYILMMVQHFVS